MALETGRFAISRTWVIMQCEFFVAFTSQPSQSYTFYHVCQKYPLGFIRVTKQHALI